MAETHSRTVSWPDVDEDTFVRFCEFCYKDNYSNPSWQVDSSVTPLVEVQESVEVADLITRMEEDLYRGWGRREPYHPKRAVGRNDIKNFWGPFPTCSTSSIRHAVTSNTSAGQDFTPVFLAHAKLYVLADRYRVDNLRLLVLGKLHGTLQEFLPYKERIGDIVELVKFAYSDENTLGNGAGNTDDLRKLVARYVAFQVDSMRSSEEFMELLQKNCDLIHDFLAEIGTQTLELAERSGVKATTKYRYLVDRDMVNFSSSDLSFNFHRLPCPTRSSSSPRHQDIQTDIQTPSCSTVPAVSSLAPLARQRPPLNRPVRVRLILITSTLSRCTRAMWRKSNTTTTTTTATTTATATTITMPWNLRSSSKDSARKHISPAHSEVELPPRRSEHSIRSRPRSPLPRLSETQGVAGDRSSFAHDVNGSRLDVVRENDARDPAVTRLATKRNRFSLMKFRHASDPQLSSSYQNSEPPPVPKLLPPPTIITTSPTNNNLDLPGKGQGQSQDHGHGQDQSRFSQSSHNLVSEGDVVSRSSSPGLTGRPRKDRSTNPTPPATSNAKSSHICFEETGRLSTTSLRSGHRNHAHADSQSALSNARLSESSRSDASSGDRSVYQSQSSKKESTSAASSIFRFPRLKKSRASLFPVPVKIPPPDGQSFHRQTQSSKSADLHSDSTPLPSPSQSSSGRPPSTAGSPRPPLFRKDSGTSGRSKTSISPAATDRAKRRARSSTLGSLHNIHDDTDTCLTPDITPPAVNAPRKSFSDLFSIHTRLKQNLNDLPTTPPSGTPTTTPGTGTGHMTPTTSKSNSFSLARELSSYPARSSTDTSATYLSRLESSVHRGAIATILSQSSEEFYSVALRKYMRGFSFFGDPLDMAIRKLLMEAELPRETQQIDRMIQSFANRYHECNPGIFASTEQAYFISFSLLILHTDVFNKNNKRKMQRADYVKNTRGEGVADEILECFYDNICYTPFIHVEDELNLNSRLSSPKARSNLMTKMASTDHLMKSSKDPIDPYALILEGKVASLRPNLKNVMELEDVYSSTPTTITHLPACPSIAQLNHTFDNPCILQIVSARSRPDAFMTESSIANPAESQPGLVDIRVVKVGLLWRKDAKKKKALSPWQEWGAVLTGSQLYLFRDVQWVKSLIAQYDAKHKKDSHPPAVTFTPPIADFKPDTIMSTADAVALLDSNYKKHKHAFLLVRHGGFEEVFLANSDAEMADWMNLVNHAATYRTSGIRMRGSEKEKLVKADPQHTHEAHAARRTQVAARIKEANEKLFVSQRQVDMLLRNARHLQHLTPIHPRTRGQVILSAGRMAAKIKWARLELERLKCHRGILARDLAEEEGRVGSSGWKKEVGLALGQMMDGASDIGDVTTLLGEKEAEKASISTSQPSNWNGIVASDAMSIAKESNRQSISSTIASKQTNLSTPNPNPATTPITDTDSTSNAATPTPSITDDDEEQRFLRETGILGLDTASLSSPPNSPGKKEPITPISTNAPANPSGTHPSSPPSSERSKVRRSFQRTLREAHHNVPLHRTSRKGRDRDSSTHSSIHSTATGGSGGNNNNNPCAPSTPTATSDEPGTLARKSPSFTVHGKKASVITFGSEWQSLSPEQRLKQRKPQSHQQLQPSQSQSQGQGQSDSISISGVDDGTDSVFSASIVSTLGGDSPDQVGAQPARSGSVAARNEAPDAANLASNAANAAQTTDLAVTSRCSPTIGDIGNSPVPGSGNNTEHQVSHDDAKLVVA
ncbi:uncharacterized protein GIQ15_05770 [Arthroderma uncinatum]|uniref:uncharacterized protein n=1 Tax=Arthroderma uncinatum TaxID=74035 RepID=UPI00144AEF2A|nr:uncharacterized protein GIQ15_05770 [Arthroderma uncinatum]KAF3480423.1 hypothetical protein GIQ15_05770 [Arthroderma uncinatum]